MAGEYRPCVVGVFTNAEGRVLVCERSDVAGAWQFPQGGIEPGEMALNALYREMKEELGCDDFKVICQSPLDVRYKFPENLESKIKKKWIGQSQIWFKLVFLPNCAPDMSQADGEFQDYKWVTVEESLEHIVSWKKNAYMEGLKEIGLL
ncbi:MAG: RNA pyrophosphohydrolase [Proteobacteria bacterium]|nr:RNA pyrophosphohydrolase [Pseudomonadota bacterium]